MVISDEVKLIISVDDKIAWWWKNRFFGEIGVVYYGRCVEGMQPDERSSQSSMWVVVVLLRSWGRMGAWEYVNEDLGGWKYDLDNCLGCGPGKNRAKAEGFVEH